MAHWWSIYSRSEDDDGDADDTNVNGGGDVALLCTVLSASQDCHSNGALTPESDSTVSEAATEVDHNTSFKAAHIMQTMWARWSSAVQAGGFNGVVTQWQSQGVTGFTGSQCKDSQFHSFTVQTTSRVPQCTQVHISQLSGINFRCAFIYNWIALLGKALKDAMSVGRIWRDMRKPMMFFFLPEDQL